MSDTVPYSYLRLNSDALSCGFMGLHFMGSYNSATVYKNGDLVTDGFRTRMFQNGEFIELYSLEDITPPPRKVITQCRNCGAPTDGDGHCPYCGTYNFAT